MACLLLDKDITMTNLMDMSDEDLRNFVPEVGFWCKLCKARRLHLKGTLKGSKEGSLSLNIPAEEHNPSMLPYGSITEFLHKNGISPEQYLPKFKGEELQEPAS